MRLVSRLMTVCAIGLALGCASDRCEANSAEVRLQAVQANVIQARFVGDIHGARAMALVSFETMREYVLMAGQIDSGPYRYTFHADIVGQSGFGEMVSHADNTRFRIRVDATANGFALTSNPFGPGQPTTYYFFRN